MGVLAWVESKWKGFTGEVDFERAERLYTEVSVRFKCQKQLFEQGRRDLAERIEQHVEQINASKRRLKTELFPFFADKMSYIKEVRVAEEWVKDSFVAPHYIPDTVQEREALYLIDFDKNAFMCNMEAICLLGFTTRKKAKETLIRVQEEAARVEVEMERMDSELLRLERLQESLGFAANIYASLTRLYEKLIYRFDGVVSYLIVNSFKKTQCISDSYMSMSVLTEEQKLEVNVVVSMSKIMKSLTETEVSMSGKIDKVKKSKDEFSGLLKMATDKYNEVA